MPEPENPYVGPYSFEEKDARLFFGREREAQHLTALIVSERVVLFYAQSGAGKTSLVNAKLVPELKRKGFHVFPPVRVGGELLPGDEPRNVYVYNVLKSLNGSHPPDESLDGFLSVGLTGKPEGSPPQVLILDQFEEILTTHPKRLSEREDFFVQLRQALQDDPSLSVVLVLREDLLAGLDPYIPLLGGHLRARFRLERLGREQAVAAIRKPAEKTGRPFEPEVAEQLAKDLCQFHLAGQTETITGDVVEPVYLQAVCFQLWENLRRRPGETITAKDLKDFGDVDRALESFYETAVARAAREAKVPETRIRHWCGATLITPTHIRSQVSREAELTGGLPNKAVEVLVDAHLIRPETARGGIWYELAHDRLIDPILRSNARAIPEEGRQLEADATAWRKADRDPSFLYGGSRLERALKSAKEQGATGELESEFLAESRQEAKRSAERDRLTARLRILTRCLAIGSLLLLFVAVAVYQQSRVSASRELALVALDNLRADPQLSLLLALEAVGRSRTPEAESALHQALDSSTVRPSWSFPIPNDSISALAFSADGTRCATSGPKGGVEIRDAASGRRLLFLSGPVATAASLAFSPRGDRLAYGDFDGRVLLLDSRSGKLVRALAAGAAVNSLAFSPDATRLAVATDNPVVEVWDVASGRRTLALSGHMEPVFDVAFRRDGRYLATAGQDGAAIVWDARTGRAVHRLMLAGKPINGLDFAPDGRLATAHQDFQARIWDPHTWVARSLYGHRDWVWDVAFSRDGAYLATSSFDGTAKLWDARSMQELASLTPKGNQVVRIAFNPRTGDLASTSRIEEQRDGRATLWKTFFGDIPTLAVSSPVAGVAFSPDGRRIVTGDRKGRVILWDTTGRQLARLGATGSPIQSLAFDGHLVAASHLDGTLHVGELPEGREIGTLPGPVRAVALSPDGRLLAGAGKDGTTTIWETASRRSLLVLIGHRGPVRSVGFSRDGRLTATGGEDKTVAIWDVTTGKKVRSFTARSVPLAVAFAPDAQRMAAAGEDGAATLWDVESGKELSLEGHADSVTDVAFSPDGKRLATASRDATARIWEVESGRPLFTLRWHTGGLSRLAFSPDGKRLATASSDGTVRLEPLAISSLVRLARSRLSRSLTEQERRIYLHE